MSFYSAVPYCIICQSKFSTIQTDDKQNNVQRLMIIWEIYIYYIVRVTRNICQKLLNSGKKDIWMLLIMAIDLRYQYRAIISQGHWTGIHWSKDKVKYHRMLTKLASRIIINNAEKRMSRSPCQPAAMVTIKVNMGKITLRCHT